MLIFIIHGEKIEGPWDTWEERVWRLLDLCCEFAREDRLSAQEKRLAFVKNMEISPIVKGKKE